MKKIAVLSLLLIFLSSFAFAGTVKLPRTGQTKCWDTDGYEIPCAGTGQDGEIQVGVVWPEPRFTDNGDDTIIDNLTGLMWTKDAYLPGTTMNWYQALDFCNNLNLGGYSDWRLPNVNELESLVNADESSNATWLNKQGFINVVCDNQFYLGYWSSTTSACYADSALAVNMCDGLVDSVDAYKFDDLICFVWPVRAGQDDAYPSPIWKTGQTVSYYEKDDGELRRGIAWPTPRFTDPLDGTVTDNLTGLMWAKNANLPGENKTWQQALDYVKVMNAGAFPNLGYTDWRLPNRKEYYSLTDFSQCDPALPEGHPFTNVQGDYCSSTTIDSHADSVYIGAITTVPLTLE
jgi:hypothetical protein